jgi:hypothetical protein
MEDHMNSTWVEIGIVLLTIFGISALINSFHRRLEKIHEEIHHLAGRIQYLESFRHSWIKVEDLSRLDDLFSLMPQKDLSRVVDGLRRLVKEHADAKPAG